jgi:hypothetical protein
MDGGHAEMQEHFSARPYPTVTRFTDNAGAFFGAPS